MVGAGVGGASAALFLRRRFGADAAIDVFESGAVGGRVADVRMAGHLYEVGGTIIHGKNKEMKKLVKELGT